LKDATKVGNKEQKREQKKGKRMRRKRKKWAKWLVGMHRWVQWKVAAVGEETNNYSREEEQCVLDRQPKLKSKLRLI